MTIFAEKNDATSPWDEIAADLEPQRLDRLPEKYRLPILLRFYQKKSLAQVAALLRISEPAAEKRVARALDRLRQQLRVSSPGTPLSSLTIGTLLMAHVITPAPPTLAASLGAACAGSASLHVTSLMKGILVMSAKAKIAAIAAGIILLAIPATIVVVIHYASPASQPEPSVAPAPGPGPAIPAADPLPADGEPLFKRYYSLKPQQVVAFANAPRENRNAIFAYLNSLQTVATPETPFAMIIRQSEGAAPQIQGGIWGRGSGYSLSDLMAALLEIPSYQLQADPAIANLTLDGDVLVRAGATKEQVLAGLESAISEQLHTPLSLKLRQVDAEVYVLHGQWHSTATPGKPAQIQFYETDDSQASRRQTGTQSTITLGSLLGRYLNAPVAVEATGLPATISYAQYAPAGKYPEAALVLNHPAEQTGLTWITETRPTERLLVELKNGDAKLP